MAVLQRRLSFPGAHSCDCYMESDCPQGRRLLIWVASKSWKGEFQQVSWMSWDRVSGRRMLPFTATQAEQLVARSERAAVFNSAPVLQLLPSVTWLDGEEGDNSAELLLMCLACSLWLEQLCGSLQMTREVFSIFFSFTVWLFSVAPKCYATPWPAAVVISEATGQQCPWSGEGRWGHPYTHMLVDHRSWMVLSCCAAPQYEATAFLFF